MHSESNEEAFQSFYDDDGGPFLKIIPNFGCKTTIIIVIKHILSLSKLDRSRTTYSSITRFMS